MQASDASRLGWRERLLGSLRRAGALAPDALTAGRALGEVTGVGHLGLLPTLLSGFFGVCSPQGARIAEAQLLELARELAGVRTAPSQFAREGMLQLLRDFIGESARSDSDQARTRLRRVLVKAVSTGAPLEHSRRFFVLCTRLSTREVELLRALARGAHEADALLAEPLAIASVAGHAAEEHAAGASSLSLALLVCEGLVRELESDAPNQTGRRLVVSELGRQLLSWMVEDSDHAALTAGNDSQ